MNNATARPADSVSIIASIFAAELKQGSVGPDDNFFDLGGDSLIAENLVLALQHRFSRVLPTAILLEAPTPGELARLIASEADEGSSDLVVSVPGCGGSEPLVFVHGVAGTALFADRFGDRLKQRYAVMALRARGIEPGEYPHRSLADMVDDYYHAMESATGRPPSTVGGLCMGGIIAIEIGRKAYLDRGIKPRLILLDPPPLGSHWLRPKPDRMIPLLKLRLEYLAWYRNLLRVLFDRLGLDRTPRGRMARRKSFEKMMFRSMAGYTPPVYPCDVLLLASAEWAPHTVEQYRQWHAGCGRMRTMVLDGGHLNLNSANSDTVAREILAFLSQDDTETSSPSPECSHQPDRADA
ncbi:MAG: alpha/beta fold hydrolase [Rhizobiaceae bacterium]|nr:alpha/beta fold hydrolase [Rhizobiaceae bacterium]